MPHGTALDTNQGPPDASGEPDDKYVLLNQNRICGLLQSLIDQRSQITAHIGGIDQSFQTSALELDKSSDSLILDASSNESVNLQAIQADHLLCFAQLEQVRLLFRVDTPTRIDHEGLPAFCTSIPQSLYYPQRREFYRLETPISDHPTCTIKTGSESANSPAPELRVLDISCGGLAVALPPGMPLLNEGATYSDCLLQIPDSPPISVQLIVCCQVKQTLPNGNISFRLCMKFATLPRGADQLIQRYIFRIERLRSSRVRGAY